MVPENLVFCEMSADENLPNIFWSTKKRYRLAAISPQAISDIYSGRHRGQLRDIFAQPDQGGIDQVAIISRGVDGGDPNRG